MVVQRDGATEQFICLLLEIYGTLPLPGTLGSGSVLLKIFVERQQCTKLWDTRRGLEALRRGHEAPGAAQGEECIFIDTL